MTLITKEVEVTLSGKNIKYYEDLGYKIPRAINKWHPQKLIIPKGTLLKVKIDDLQKHSSVIVEVECDYCHRIIPRKYREYTTKQNICHKDSCTNCKQLLVKELNIIRFGVESKSVLPEVQSKVRKTTYEHFGYEFPSQSPIVRDKITQSYINKYGVDNPNKCHEVRSKITQTLYNNQSQKTSNQQGYICDLYNGILNYPISHYNTDMAFPNENLVCEYNGGGHWLNVETGRITQEEFSKKEIIRNEVLKCEGWKQMIIISRQDKLPSDKKLLELLSYTRNFFKENPERSWIEFDIDNSIIRNALHKDGEFFNYGKLRRLSKRSA